MAQFPPHSPYVGLRPYTEDDRAYFFGREEERETIAANLLSAPLTLLYGASGVGKSSMLMAAVVPYLHTLPNLVVVTFRAWQEGSFLSALKESIAHAVAAQSGQTVALDLQSPLDDFILQATRLSHCNLVLILDQFEEYFLYHPPSDNDDDRFDEEFARAVNRAEIGANFLVSLRDDSFSLLDRFEGRIPNLMNNYLRLKHLDAAGAVQAILRPLEMYNQQRMGEPPIAIEAELVHALIEQVQIGHVAVLGKGGRARIGATQIEAPFLQMVLTRLWDEELQVGSHILRLETLQRLGGAEHIVGSHIDSVMSHLSANEQDIAAHIFSLLVTPSGTKIALSADDLIVLVLRPAAEVRRVLESLIHERLLRELAPPFGQPSSPRFEIFHDVLAAAVLDWRRRYMVQRDVTQRER